jgi:hypothetical protein
MTSLCALRGFPLASSVSTPLDIPRSHRRARETPRDAEKTYRGRERWFGGWVQSLSAWWWSFVSRTLPPSWPVTLVTLVTLLYGVCRGAGAAMLPAFAMGTSPGAHATARGWSNIKGGTTYGGRPASNAVGSSDQGPEHHRPADAPRRQDSMGPPPTVRRKYCGPEHADRVLASHRRPGW